MSSGKIINNFQFEKSNEFNLNVDFSYSQKNNLKIPFNFSIQLNRNDLEDILYRILMIHSFLKNNSRLSNDQRFDYCRIERELMIQYLKEIVKKV